MSNMLLSYDDALARILDATPILPPQIMELGVAVNGSFALAEDIVADHDLPLFDNSAVDGYALNGVNLGDGETVILPITQTVAAGDWSGKPVLPGEAARIYTGAPIPPGTDAIVMQEDTETVGDSVRITANGSASFTRRAGSDVHRGETVLQAGTMLDPGAFALLGALNRRTISVGASPRVALFTTGDEVIPYTDTTESRTLGKIHDANGPGLMAAIRAATGNLPILKHLRDDSETVRRELQSAAVTADIIVTSGGVSLGNRDFVTDAVREIGDLDFWRVAIRPGKPLAFGKIGETLFFGLPGNPVSSLVTFEIFVRPVLRKMAGYKELLRPQIGVTLTADLPHEVGRREFVRASLSWKDGICLANPTGLQGSHRLLSMRGADALLIADENRGDYRSGETMTALWIIGS